MATPGGQARPAQPGGRLTHVRTAAASTGRASATSAPAPATLRDTRDRVAEVGVADRAFGQGPDDQHTPLVATDQGRGNEIWSKMFRAHFGQARKLWSIDEVLDFAAEVGLDHDEAATALRERRYEARVAADQAEAQRLGAHGTPLLAGHGRIHDRP